MPSTIIAIDDSVEVLLSIGATLEPDHDIRIATSGEEGLALAIPHAASLASETVSISVGGACESQFTGQSSASLLKRADDSLYQVKKQGRNRLILQGC